MWETPLSENLQKEIVSAYERLCRPIPTNPIELLGYKISFMGEAHLRWLFGEISWTLRISSTQTTIGR